MKNWNHKLLTDAASYEVKDIRYVRNLYKNKYVICNNCSSLHPTLYMMILSFDVEGFLIFLEFFPFSLIFQIYQSFFSEKINLFVELLQRRNRFDKLRWKIHLRERVMENPIILHHLSRWAPSLVWERWRLLSASRYAFTHTITKGDEPNYEVTHGKRI